MAVPGLSLGSRMVFIISGVVTVCGFGVFFCPLKIYVINTRRKHSHLHNSNPGEETSITGIPNGQEMRKQNYEY